MRCFITAAMIAARLSHPNRDGQELLPQLVDKLITASVPSEKIHHQRFPSGGAVALPGPDGVLAVDESVDHDYVPNGLSLWEMGTSADPKSKADKDFPKAEGKLAGAFPSSVTPDKATFVFVTSGLWDSSAWVKTKRASSKWKSILVRDAVALEKWIEQCPGVMLWFAQVCGLPAEGLYDAEQYLRKLAVGFGVSTVSPELVIAGRADNQNRLRDLVLQSNVEVHVRGESVEAAAGFLAAASLQDAEAYATKPPLVFADSRANLNLLATFGAELTLVPLDCEALARAKLTTGQSWRMVIPEVDEGGSSCDEGKRVDLDRCKRDAMERDLIAKMGLPEHKARQIARDTKGSFVALLWLVSSGLVGVPRWTTRKDATTHASLMLAGSWVGTNGNDTKIVERLSRKDYRDVETLLQSAEIPEGPWIHRAPEWLCAAKDFVWGQLVGKVTETMLADFLTSVDDVLGEKDPSLELSATDRPMAGILGKRRKFSSSLRAGLVDALARLAIFMPEGQAWADRIVRGLLDPQHPEASVRWFSLVDVYSEIAEAAPEVFLKCVDAMVRSGGAKDFFQDVDSDNVFFGPTSAHTYLLWALERLAWQKQYLPRVLRILAKLAEIDPGGRTSNRPDNSLVTILMPWSPQHSDTMENAIEAIRMLYSVAPDVTWGLAMRLLPKSHDVTSPTPEPSYRQHPGERQVTVEEYWEFTRSLLEMVIEWAGKDAHRWASLIKEYPHVRRGYAEAGQLVTDALKRVKTGEFVDEAKAIAHAALREVISLHRKHPDADWALTDSDLTLLESLQKAFRPADPVLLFANLFSWRPDVPEAPMKEYENGWDEWIAGQRASAVKAVHDQDGLKGVCRLAEAVVLPESVGQGAANLPLSDAEVVQLLCKGLSVARSDYAGSALAKLARGYVWSKHKEGGEKWIEGILALPGLDWTGISYANMALAIPPSPSLWERLDQWGADADRLYWKHVVIWTDLYEHWEMILDKWKEVSRPWSSLELVARLVDERPGRKPRATPAKEQVMDILEQALGTDQSVEPHRQQAAMLSYYLERVFLYLDAQGADVARMARLEWGWLGLLEHTKRGPRVLQAQVASSPELFLELLKAVFRAENEPRSKTVSEDQRKVGQQAFRVLNGIQTVPGYQSTPSGEIVDQGVLREWVIGARTLAKEAKQIVVCDSHIGQILSYAPSSPDGSWPCVEVRDLIEGIQSEELESGFRIGRYNQRGAFFRDTGGKQEWGLAKKYHALADQVRSQWPRTAAILDGLARGYELEAKKWDEEARREEFE